MAAASKRKMPLMIGNTPSPKVARYSKNLPIDQEIPNYKVESVGWFSVFMALVMPYI